MSDDCGIPHKAVQQAVRQPLRHKIEESCILQGPEGARVIQAINTLRELSSLIHRETHPTIGHIHNILGDSQKTRALQLRTDFISVLSSIPESERNEHINPELESCCGSVLTFIKTSQFPITTFESTYSLLTELDGFFHESGEGHIHKTPSSSSLPDMHKLRDQIRQNISQIAEEDRQRIAAALNTCCRPTLDFIKSGQC